jgi:thiol:disulfide interchange protein DsbD
MKKLYTLIICTLFAVPAMFGQMTEQPVKWQHKLVEKGDNIVEIQIVGQIDDREWHLYDLGPYTDGPIATTLTVSAGGNCKVVGKPYLLTPSKKAFDETFGMEIGTLTGKFIFAQKVELTKNTKSKIKVTIEWQTCNDSNCLPPTDEEFDIELPAGKINAPAVAAKTDAAPGSSSTVKETEVKIDTVPANVKKDSISVAAEVTSATTVGPAPETASTSIWSVIFEAIMWGFIALLTPCVFPMVPMTVSFFLKNSQGGSKSKGRLMASFYGLSIVALYTIPIAVIIGITYFAGGATVTADIFNWLATHWLPNIIFFLIFMVFAASFFGAFEITLPSWMVNKSDSKSDKGGLIGVFFMALTLVLVSFSCTGPIVGSVLIKSTQGEIWQPIVTMLAFSTAFALPFTIFAFAPSLLKDLPKSGGWLNNVKVVLGFIEVALGFKFLSVADQTYHWGILDREVYLAIWIVVFTLMGFYLLGKLRFAHDDEPGYITVKKLTLAIITFSFVVYMIPGMWGAPLKALSGYLPPITTMDFNMQSGEGNNITSAGTQELKPKYSDFLHLPHNLHGFFEYKEAVAYAKKVGKPLFVDFTGHGCVNCREMEARVWSDPRVLKLFNEDFVMLALYADDKKEAAPEDWITTPTGKELKSIGKINSYIAMTKYNVNAQPFYAIIDPNTEKYIVPPMGYNLDIETYIKFLESGIKNMPR